MKKGRRILTAALVAFMGLFACAGFLACGDNPVNLPAGVNKPKITFVPAADEDCGNDGHIGYYTDGEKYFSDEAGEHELDWEQDILIPATGQHQAAVAWQKGNGKHWHNCSVCDTKITSTEADHDFEWKTDRAPTATQPGEQHEECECGEKRNEHTVIPALDAVTHHGYTAPTCGEDGNEEYWEKGGKYYSDAECTEEYDGDPTIPATGEHQEEADWQVEAGKHWKNCSVCENKIDSTEADCTPEDEWQTENGKHYHNCEECGEKIDSTEADCTPEDEWVPGDTTHWHNCEECGEKIDSTEELHDFEWKTDEEPTETQPGEKHEECDCGAKRNENTEIPSLSTIVEHPYKEPTCGEDGNEHYWERGGKYYSDAECTEEYDGDPTIPATGEHQEEEDWHTENGKHWKHCSVCGQKLLTTVANCTAEDEWQTENGKHWKNCEDCGEKIDRTEGDCTAEDEWQTENGKHWHNCEECGEKIDGSEADCTEEDEWQIDEEGDKHYHNCSVCGQKMEDTSDDHHYTDTVVDPTCTEGGYTEHKCEECGKTYTDGEVEATGHSYEAEWEWTKGEDGTYTATVTFICSECEDTHGPITAENVRVSIDEDGHKIYETDAVEFDNKQYPGYYVVELDNITLSISGVQQNFYAGTEFNYDNLVVVAHYKDGSSEEVEPDRVSTPVMTEKGEKEVLVTYKSAEEAYTINIIDAGEYNGSELTMNAADTVVKDCHTQSNESFDFVGGINVGSTLTFMFDSTVDDTVALRIYGNGNGVGYFAVTISCDGETISTTERVTLNTGGADWWTKWEVPFFVASFNVENGKRYTVVFTATGEGIEANINYLKIAPANGYNGKDGMLFKGDSAEITGGEWQPNNDAGAIIGGLSTGSSFSFTFVSIYDGPVGMVVTLAGGIRNTYWEVKDNAAKIHIYINGSEVVSGGQEVTSGGFTDWEQFVYEINLSIGVNVIEFKILDDVTINTGEAVFFNFYSVELPPVYSEEELTIGATHSTVIGNGKIENGFDTTFDGSLVGGIGAGTIIKLSVCSEAATAVKLFVSMDGNAGSEVTFEIYVNGTKAGEDEYKTTASGWLNFNEVACGTVSLAEGVNTVEIRSKSGGFNFNYLRIVPADAA